MNGPPSELLSRVEKDAADDTAWTQLERSHREQDSLPALWATLAELIDARPARSDLVERLVGITARTPEDGKRLMAVLERRLAALIAAGAATDLVAACHTDLGNLWLAAFSHGDHALEHYRAAMAADRRYVGAIYAARKLLRERGELPEADRLFELEALAEPDPKRKVALLIELGHFRVRELADLARAVDAFERAHNLEPENPLATRMLAHALTEQAAANPDSDPGEVRAVVASLYFQLATVAPPEQALSYAEEALAALPTHEAALELLEEVAAKTDRADLLPTRWVQYLEQVPEGAFASVRRRRLGRAYIENKQPMDAIRCLEPIAKRGDPEAAELLIEIYQRLGRDDDAAGAMMTTLAGLSGKGRVPILERVLHLRIDAGREHDALDVAKEILELSPASEVALELLEQEWTRTQEYPLLKRAYARAAESDDVSPTLRKRVLLELAALGEGALADPELAIRTWELLSTHDPIDPLPKAALERLYESRGLWQELAGHLERCALGVTAPEERARIHHKLAGVLSDRLRNKKDAVRALRVYRAVHPEDKAARDRLADLLLETGAAVEAVALLRARADDLDPGPERARVLRKLAEILERDVEDPEGAYEAYADILESEPNDADALAAMARIDEGLGRWERLAETLAYQAEICAPGDRSRLLFRMGEVYEHELRDVERAQDRYAEALVAAPEDDGILDALARCYGRAGRHRDLVELLSQKARRASDARTRVQLHRRIARILSEQLDNPRAASEAWENVLTDDPANEEALRFAVDSARRGKKSDRLVVLLTNLADVAPTEDERVELLLEKATILRDDLGKPEDALAVVEHVTEHVAPAHATPVHVTALDWLRAHYEENEQFDRECEVLRRLLGLSSDGPAKAALARRLADVELHRRQNTAGAESAIRAWIAAAPRDPEPTRRLCSLLERTGRWEDLRDELDLLAALEDGRAQRQALLRAADICVTFLRDAEGAFARIGELASEGDTEAAAILERIERNESIAPGAAEIKLRRATEERDPERKKSLLLDAARLLEVRAADRSRAFEVTQLAFELDPTDDRTLPLLERRAEAAGRRDELGPLLTAAQRQLDSAIHKARTPDELVAALLSLGRFSWTTLRDEALFEACLSRAVRAADRDEDLLARVERAVLALDTHDAASAVEAFVAELSLESERVVDAPEQSAEVLRRAARLLSLQLASPWEAIDVLKRASHLDPSREAILDDLEAACRRAGALRELDGHLEALAKNAVEAKPATLALRRRTQLLVSLSRHAEAAEVLRQLWVLRPNDRAVPNELAQCLRRTDRYQELVGVLERMLERTESATEKAALLREIAHTWEFRLENPWEAIRSWNDLLSASPGDAEAQAALLRLEDDLHVPTDPEVRRSPSA